MKKYTPILIFLILIAIFFRFYRVSNYLYFTIDEERDSFIMQKVISDNRPTLIGPAVPKLTYLGPFYFNFSAVIFKIMDMDLVKMGGVASLIGVLNVILLFFTIKNIFSRKIAFLSAFIYSVSFLISIYNRNYWPLTYTQFAVIGTYFCLDKILKGKNNYIFLLAVPLIVGIQSEPTAFSLIPLVLLTLHINKIREYKKTIVLFLIILLSHLSLLLFDFLHNHFLLNMLLNFFKGTHRAGGLNIGGLINTIYMVFLTFIRVFHIFGSPDASLQIAPIGNYLSFRSNPIPIWFQILSGLMLAYFFRLSIHSQKIKIFASHILIVILGIGFYNLFFPGYTFEWFVNCLFPAFSVIWAYTIVKLIKNKYLLIGVISLIFAMNFNNIIRGGNSFSIKTKIDAVLWTSKKIGASKYELISIGGWSQGGYRYLFEQYGMVPVKSYQDGIFAGWMYPKTNIKPVSKVVFVSELDFQDKKFLKEYNNYKKAAKFKNKFGNIEVLII